MIKGYFVEARQGEKVECLAEMQQAHRNIQCIIIGGKKVMIILPYIRARKLIPNMLYLMSDRTVLLEMMHPQTGS